MLYEVITIFAHCYESDSNIEEIYQLITSKNFAVFNFKKEGKTDSNLTDIEYIEHVELAKKHCARGDVRITSYNVCYTKLLRPLRPRRLSGSWRP